MKLHYFIVIAILTLTIIPVQAVVTTFPDIHDARLYYWHEIGVDWPTLRNHNAIYSTDPPASLIGSINANATSGYYFSQYASAITFDTHTLEPDAVIDSATLQGCAAYRSGGMGVSDLGLLDYNTAGVTYSPSDFFTKTTLTRMASDIPYASLAPQNTSVTWTLNAAGLAKINKTGNTTFMITTNKTIDNQTPTWSSGNDISLGIRSASYLSGYCIPNLNVTYHYDYPDVYPITDPTNKTQSQYLPDTTITISEGDHVNVTAAKGEYESGSFVIKGNSDITGVNISIPTLNDGGNNIPASAIDIKIVVPAWNVVNKDSSTSWNWSSPPFPYGCSNRWLSNAQLWHNETKFARNDAACSNYVLIRQADGTEVYQNVSSETDKIPPDAVFDDSATIQPFTINATKNKQFWITVNVSPTQATGNYSGNMSLTRPDGTYLNNITLNVRVRNFTLANSTMQYSAYYVGLAGLATTGTGVSATNKTIATYASDLADMRKGGINYPLVGLTSYLLNDTVNASIDARLIALNQSGLPKDAVYFFGHWGPLLYNVTSTENINTRVATANYLKSRATYYGFAKTYIYGMDEENEPILSSQRPVWTSVRLNGSFIITAVNLPTGDPLAGELQYANVADILDTVNVAGGYNTTIGSIAHAYGHKVLAYAYPESGLPNPEIYRKNYGFRLFNASYDGAGVWAWQYGHGVDAWNHFDQAWLTDESFTLPTSNGSVYTLGLQGFREATDDNRYVATLINADGGNKTYANTSVFSNISAGRLPADIRNQIANQIEYDILNPPTEPEAPPATTYWTNGTIDYNRLLLMHNDVTSFLGLRNGHGNNIYDTPDTLRAQTAAAASIIPNTYADYHYRSEVSMLPSVPEGATVDSAYFNMYFNQSTSGIGATTMCIVDSTKTGTSWAMDDYEKTTLTKLSDDCKTGTTVNELVTWTLNPTGISKITPGGRLTMMLEDNIMVAGAVSNYTWVANENSRLWFQSTNIAGRSPFYNISYHTGTTGAPVAAFTSNVTSGISPLTVQFTNQSYSYITGWNWTFRDVAGNNTELSFSNAENPVKTFGAGTYDIKLNVTNVAGFSKTAATYYVTVSGSSPPSGEGLPSPTSYWDFNEGAGSTAYDPVGARNGAISASGASWSTDGYTGGSLLFNGYGTVTASNTTYYNFTGDYTVSMWVNASQELSNNVDFFNNGEVLLRHITSPGASTGDIYHMHNTVTTPAGGAFTGYGTTQMQYELPNNKWTNIMAVMRGDTMSIYINGVKDRDLPYALGTPSTTYDKSISGVTREGLTSLVMGNGFVGKIDEVKIWNIGLTEAQIKSSYNHKPTILEKGWVDTIGAPLSDTQDELNAFEIHEGERLKFEVVAKDLYRSNFTFSMTSGPTGATFVESPNYYPPYYKGEVGVFTWTPSSGQTGTFTPCLVVTNATSSVSDQVCIPITVKKSYMLDPASCAAGYYVRGDGECVPTLKSTYGYESNPSTNPVGGGVNYGQIYTTGDYRVSNLDQFLYALNHATSGQVIYVIPNSTIDVTTLHERSIPAGVTIASDRGNAGSLGALIYSSYNTSAINHPTYAIFMTSGNNIRFTGIRLQGPDTSRRYEQYQFLNGGDYNPYLPNDLIVWQRDTDSGLTIDNCEVDGFGEAAIYPETSSTGYMNVNVSYNYAHYQQRFGGGYIVWANRGSNTTFEGNILNYGRHYISGSRNGPYPPDYRANYNILGDRHSGYALDNHGGNDVSDVNQPAGRNMTVYGNTIYPMGGDYASHGVRGIPSGWSFDRWNWAKAVSTSDNTSAHLFLEEVDNLAGHTQGIYYNMTVSNNWINQTRPTSIGALTADTSVANQITFNFIKPADSAIDHIKTYKDGVYQSDIAGTATSVTFSGLTAGTAYTLGTSACSGASVCGDSPWYNLTVVASGVGGDSTPPLSISSLTNTTPTQSDVTFSWTNPTDSDFNQTMVWINGTAISSLPNTTSSLHLTGLPTGTVIEFSSKTVDLAGNINATAVSRSITTAGPVVGASIWLEQTSSTLTVGNATTVLVKAAGMSDVTDIRVNISAIDTTSLNVMSVSKNATSPSSWGSCTAVADSDVNGVIYCSMVLDEMQDISSDTTLYDIKFYADQNPTDTIIHLETDSPGQTMYYTNGDPASFNLVTDTSIHVIGLRTTTPYLDVSEVNTDYRSSGAFTVSFRTSITPPYGEDITGFNGTLAFNKSIIQVTGITIDPSATTDGWVSSSTYDNTEGTVNISVHTPMAFIHTGDPTPIVDVAYTPVAWTPPTNVSSLNWSEIPTYYTSGYTQYPQNINSYSNGSVSVQEDLSPSTIALSANPSSISVGNVSKVFVNVNHLDFTSTYGNYVHLAIDPIDTDNLKVLSITPNSSGGRTVSLATSPSYTCTPVLANSAGKINCRLVLSPPEVTSITSSTTLLDINILAQNNSHGSELLPISIAPFSTNYYDGLSHSFESITNATITTTGARNATSFIALSNESIGVGGPIAAQLSVNGISNVTGIAGNFTFNKTATEVRSITLNAAGIADGWTLARGDFSNVTGLVNISLSNTAGKTYINPTDLVNINFRAVTYQPMQNFSQLQWTATPVYSSGGYSEYPIQFVSESDGNITISNTSLTHTFHIYRTDTNQSMSGTQVVNTYEGVVSGTNITSTGEFIINSVYGRVNISSTASAFYESQLYSIEITGDTTDIRMTPYTSDTPGLSAPGVKEIGFIAVDATYGNPLPGMLVSAVSYNATTDGTNYLTKLYNIPALATSITGTTMSGYTDSAGGIVFLMVPTNQYAMWFRNTTSGYNNTLLLYPSDSTYTVHCPLPGVARVNALAGRVNSSLPWYSLNSTHLMMGMIYQDTTGCTSDVKFRVWFRNNGTEVHNLTWTGFGTALILDNHTVSKAPIGTEFLWQYNATRTC